MSPLAALERHYAHLLGEGRAPPFGYSVENVAYCLVLGEDGRVCRLEDLRQGAGGRPLPLPVPRSAKRPGTTPRPFFLWDNSKYVLGLGRDRTTGCARPFDMHHFSFRDRHARALAHTGDPGLSALLRFLKGWDPARHESQPWWQPGMLDQNIVFALADDDGGRDGFLQDRPAARAAWHRELEAEGESAGPAAACLVTGRAAPTARLHPAIKGVQGAQSSGASLVSFNIESSASYGKSQGRNAPVSEAAAFGYATALNALLARGPANTVQLGDATVLFWADAPAAAGGRDAEALLASLLNPPRDGDGGGRAAEASGGCPDARTQVCFLGLSANVARLSVRFWREACLGDICRSLAAHQAELRLSPPAWRADPRPQALLYAVAGPGKGDALPPRLGAELALALLDAGTPYPRTLAAAALWRLRAGGPDQGPVGPRAAICKAWLVRQARLGLRAGTTPQHEEGAPMGLDRDERSEAYQLGRLFAILEAIHQRARGGVGIRDRFLGATLSSPALAFPPLLRAAARHLPLLAADRRTRRAAGALEEGMAEVLGRLGPRLPRHLGLEDQARFVIGYYHQSNEQHASQPVSPVGEET